MNENELREKISELEHLLALEKLARINLDDAYQSLIKELDSARNEYLNYKSEMESLLNEARALAKDAVDSYKSLRGLYDNLSIENEKLKKEKNNG